MTTHENEYRELRRQTPGDRASWLQSHAPVVNRGHWWLAHIEHAEFDAHPRRETVPEQLLSNLYFAVKIIELAVADGMPLKFAVDRLTRLALGILKSDQPSSDLPDQLTPDNLAQRAIKSFRLRRSQALTVASRLRASSEGYGGEDDTESEALRDINWLLTDLRALYPYVSDQNIRATVEQWLEIAGDLAPV
jgi:hypothetical protein